MPLKKETESNMYECFCICGLVCRNIFIYLYAQAGGEIRLILNHVY